MRSIRRIHRPVHGQAIGVVGHVEAQCPGLELADPRSSDHPSSLWAEYERVAQATDNLAMKRASQRDQIYPVFRELFRKETQ